MLAEKVVFVVAGNRELVNGLEKLVPQVEQNIKQHLGVNQCRIATLDEEEDLESLSVLEDYEFELSFQRFNGNRVAHLKLIDNQQLENAVEDRYNSLIDDLYAFSKALNPETLRVIIEHGEQVVYQFDPAEWDVQLYFVEDGKLYSGLRFALLHNKLRTKAKEMYIIAKVEAYNQE